MEGGGWSVECGGWRWRLRYATLATNLLDYRSNPSGVVELVPNGQADPAGLSLCCVGMRDRDTSSSAIAYHLG